MIEREGECVRERGREGEREREGWREGEREGERARASERKREIARERDRETERDRHREKEREREREREKRKERAAAAAPDPDHAMFFVGVSQSQFLTGLSTFGNSFTQNGSKTVPKSQNRPLGYPHRGPFVVDAFFLRGTHTWVPGP